MDVHLRHRYAPLLFAFVIPFLGGCQSYISHMVASTPNYGRKFVPSVTSLPPAQAALGVDEYFTVDVGPPDARLAVAIVNEKTAEPKGTILVLHGLGASAFWMMDVADGLAREGYRAVVIDLRGHGGSTGNWLTYGPREARDVSQVIDVLEQNDKVVGSIGVYGISFGATTSIHLAAREPRVRAVTALAPFSNLREETPHYFRTFFPGIGHMIPEERYQAALDDAARSAAFDPDTESAAAVAENLWAPVLLVHGENDLVVPHEHSRRLHAIAPNKTKLIEQKYGGHLSVWLDVDGSILAEAVKWYDEHLPREQPTQ